MRVNVQQAARIKIRHLSFSTLLALLISFPRRLLHHHFSFLPFPYLEFLAISK
jgi:hypothetical protein